MAASAAIVTLQNERRRSILALVWYSVFSGLLTVLVSPTRIAPVVFLVFLIIAGISVFRLQGTIVAVLLWVAAVVHLGTVPAAWKPLPPAGAAEQIRSMVYVAVLLLHLAWYSRTITERQRSQAQRIGNLENSVRELSEANMSYNAFVQMAESQAARHERNRISRDIHDGVGYALTNLIMLSESALDAASGADLGRTQVQLNTIRNQARMALNDTRRSLRELRASEQGLLYGVDAIIHMIEVYRQATGMRVAVDIAVPPRSVDDERVFPVAYRFVQEALTNSFRHGHADSVEVRISLLEHNLFLLVTDNGVAPEEIDEGIGIQGMRERLGEVGGDLNMHTIGGFTVNARIPLKGEFHRNG